MSHWDRPLTARTTVVLALGAGFAWLLVSTGLMEDVLLGLIALMAALVLAIIIEAKL